MWRCPQCGRTFNCQDNFHRHVQNCRKRQQDQSNDETLPAKQRWESHKCPECGHTFGKALCLERHRVQIHKPTRCTTCSGQFLGTRTLTAHRRIDHPKPFECDQCGRTFARLNNLTHHQTAKHPAALRQSGGGAAAAAAPVNEPPNWRAMADPIQYTSLPEAERSPLPIYEQKWAQICTQFRRNNRLHDWYNFHLRDLQPATMMNRLNDIFRDQRTV